MSSTTVSEARATYLPPLVCIQCGWFSWSKRCTRDGGLAIPWQKAAKACSVSTLLSLIHVPPSRRAEAFRGRRAQLRAGGFP